MNFKIERLTPKQYEIVAEIYTAVAKLKGGIELLAAIGSWGDTLPENDVLELLQDWNAKNHFMRRTPLEQRTLREEREADRTEHPPDCDCPKCEWKGTP